MKLYKFVDEELTAISGNWKRQKQMKHIVQTKLWPWMLQAKLHECYVHWYGMYRCGSINHQWLTGIRLYTNYNQLLLTNDKNGSSKRIHLL
jgi:hypothetical protein